MAEKGDVELGHRPAEDSVDSADLDDAEHALDLFDFDLDMRDAADRVKTIYTHYSDKATFFLGVVNAMVLAYFTGGHQWVLPLFFTAKLPVLFVMRGVLYTRNRFGYFLLDFCYFANLILLAYIWAAPSSERLFTVVFSLW